MNNNNEKTEKQERKMFSLMEVNKFMCGNQQAQKDTVSRKQRLFLLLNNIVCLNGYG